MSYIQSIVQFFNSTFEVALPAVGTVNVIPYLTAIVIFIGLSAIFRVLQYVVVARLAALAKHTKSDVDDTVIEVIRGIKAWVYTLVALYIALLPFTLPDTFATGLRAVVLIAVVWQLIAIAKQFIGYGVTRFVETDEDGDGKIDPNAATASDLIRLISGIVLWVFAALFILSNLGIEVTSLIAGLGIGGIAVAFALQGVLSDLFASFSIYFDKPFRIGDFIVLGADSGTVEKIGIKSTRIRTLQGQELVVSNAELTTARVENFKKMEKRRIVTTFGITYETPQAKVVAVPDMVKRIFHNQASAELDRIHFTAFGDSALLFEMVYYIQTSDYNDYLNAQQEFNYALLKSFSDESIDFAYPTQTVYHQSVTKL